jgi:hypothetical protein
MTNLLTGSVHATFALLLLCYPHRALDVLDVRVFLARVTGRPICELERECKGAILARVLPALAYFLG